MQADEIRLRVVEAVIGQATKVGLFDPVGLIESCTKLEKYVIGLPPAEEVPTPATRKTLTRPEKTTGAQPPWLK
jgi:hypothetical protein